MLMGRIFGGVPSSLTIPRIAPAVAASTSFPGRLVADGAAVGASEVFSPLQLTIAVGARPNARAMPNAAIECAFFPLT
jgi:hypothetical protein